MAKGFSGKPGDLQQLMKQAQKMQVEIQQAQAQAKAITAEASAGGGVVKVVANGDNQIASLKISPEVVNADDVEMLQDLVMAAANEALKKVGDTVQDKIAKITGGLGMPGM